MASLKKPARCVNNCNSFAFYKKKKPERWICKKCESIVVSRPSRNSTDKCYECNISRKSDVKFRKGKNICKPCYSKQQKKYREENADVLKEKRDEYYKNLDSKVRWQRVKKSITREPASFLADQLYHIRSRSNRPEHGPNPSCPIKRQCDLDRAYLQELWDEQDGKCAITKIKMVHRFGCLNSVSIDRIDSSQGHVKGNIQLVCKSINLLKHTHSNEEVFEFLKKIKLND